MSRMEQLVASLNQIYLANQAEIGLLLDCVDRRCFNAKKQPGWMLYGNDLIIQAADESLIPMMCYYTDILDNHQFALPSILYMPITAAFYKIYSE